MFKQISIFPLLLCVILCHGAFSVCTNGFPFRWSWTGRCSLGLSLMYFSHIWVYSPWNGARDAQKSLKQNSRDCDVLFLSTDLVLLVWTCLLRQTQPSSPCSRPPILVDIKQSIRWWALQLQESFICSSCLTRCWGAKSFTKVCLCWLHLSGEIPQKASRPPEVWCWQDYLFNINSYASSLRLI